MKIFGKSEKSSREIARDRLKVVLIHDRANISPEVMEHLRDDLTISQLAQAANMSARNFSRVFARDTQTTPAQFVEGARVDAARAMLQTPGLALKTVAYACGFRDAHHMRSVFMRRLGVSPQQFRLHFAAMT